MFKSREHSLRMGSTSSLTLFKSVRLLTRKQCGAAVYAAWRQTGCDIRDYREQMAVYSDRVYDSECQNSGKSTIDCRRSEQMEERGERGERCTENVLACSVRVSDAKQDGIEENIESTGFEPHVEVELSVSESLREGRKSQESDTDKPSNELSVNVVKKNTQDEKLKITFEKIREEQQLDQTIGAILKWKESSDEQPLETEVLKLSSGEGLNIYWQQWKLLSVKEGVLV